MTQRTKKQIEYILATHAVERLVPSKEAIRLCGQMSGGKLDADGAVKVLLRQYGLAQVRNHG